MYGYIQLPMNIEMEFCNTYTFHGFHFSLVSNHFKPQMLFLPPGLESRLDHGLSTAPCHYTMLWKQHSAEDMISVPYSMGATLRELSTLHHRAHMLLWDMLCSNLNLWTSGQLPAKSGLLPECLSVQCWVYSEPGTQLLA